MEKQPQEEEKKPFRLAGSIQMPEGADLVEILEENRRIQAKLARKKFEDLFDDED
ncbi:MAG: hypothetical protein M3P24_01050 [Gemmatimonadota bacterium]|nr:hypothetical protein [Gemmatimonadota bacterium]